MKLHYPVPQLILSLILIPFATVSAQNDSTEVHEYAAENHQCLKCHGHNYFTYYNDWVQREVKEKMNPLHIVDSVLFYQSNHRKFRCTDCHSSDYSLSFPHPNELRFEPLYVCMDCHSGDMSNSQYHFEKIDEEYIKSVHSEALNEEFTCWMCHNPHTYKINARTAIEMDEAIRYDNEICLSCHSDQYRFEFLSDKHLFDMLDRHQWLPNQKRHFQSVRCIECHAEMNDSILVSHNIQPKDKAVKLCVECHSENSILMGSLYKYSLQERRDKLGFVNSALLQDSYVIGANRNYFLNVASMALFGLVIVLIVIHALLRKLFRKN